MIKVVFLALSLTIQQTTACSFRMAGTVVTDWPSTNQVSTDAAPLPFFKRSFTCTSQKWKLEKMMRTSKISIGSCLSTIRYKCNPSAYTYTVCLQDVCKGRESRKPMKQPSTRPLASVMTKVQTTLNSNQTLNNFKDESWLTIIMFTTSLISTVIFSVFICRNKFKKANKTKTKKENENINEPLPFYPSITKILQDQKNSQKA